MCPRNLALHAGICVAVTLAAAYVFKGWLPRLWEAQRPTPDDSSPRPPKPEPKPVKGTEQTPAAPGDASPPVLSPVNADGSSRTPSREGVVEEDGAPLGNTTDALEESFVDVLSPQPAHVLSRRRSVRIRDISADSHISFTELGSLVAPPDHDEPT